MAATLTDIANETRTSVSTVSRVLAGGKLAMRISEPTRQRVLEAAARLGYRPNLLARSLRTRKSNTIALLVSDIANPWFGQLASLIERNLHEQGYSLVLCNSAEDSVREAEYLRLLPQKGIDGLIVVPLLTSRKSLMELIPGPLPLVILDRPIEGIEATVSSDPEQLVGILCDALDRAGVRKVCIVCGPSHIVTHRLRAEIVSRRFEVLARHEGAAQKETGREAMKAFTGLNPDAIVCTNNFLGRGVLEFIKSPENAPILAVFDELAMSHLLSVPIVSALQDIPGLAQAAVNLLLSQLAGEVVEIKPVVLNASLVTNPAFEARAKPKPL